MFFFLSFFVCLQEVARLCPKNPLPCLMAAKVCLEHLSWIDDGYNWSVQAVERVEVEKSCLASRYYFFWHFHLGKELLIPCVISFAKLQVLFVQGNGMLYQVASK